MSAHYKPRSSHRGESITNNALDVHIIQQVNDKFNDIAFVWDYPCSRHLKSQTLHNAVDDAATR